MLYSARNQLTGILYWCGNQLLCVCFMCTTCESIWQFLFYAWYNHCGHLSGYVIIILFGHLHRKHSDTSFRSYPQLTELLMNENVSVVLQSMFHEYSASKKSSPLKLFAIFSLVANLCNWKFSQLLPNHIPACLPILVDLSEHLYDIVSLVPARCLNFNSLVQFITEFTNFYVKKTNLTVWQITPLAFTHACTHFRNVVTFLQ